VLAAATTPEVALTIDSTRERAAAHKRKVFGDETPAEISNTGLSKVRAVLACLRRDGKRAGATSAS